VQLRTEGGNLTLGSVFKLIVVGWVLSFGLVFSVIFLLLVLGAFFAGETLVNGQMVHGRDALLAQLWPFLVILPIMIPLQAAMMGGLVTAGLWLYSLRRPLSVIELRPASPQS
jgi:hypothetical protein